jgi:hypothetical protein
MHSHPVARAVCLTVAAGLIGLGAVGAAGAEVAATGPDGLPKQVGVIDDTGGLPQIKRAGDVPYVSGGVSSDEADALNRMSSQFNLKLTMTIPSGQFTAPTALRIEDAAGMTVLELRPSGPLFLAKMPAGQYVIQATAEGRTLTRKVTVPSAGLEAVAMTWPAADEPVRAGDAPESQPQRAPAERPGSTD